LEKWIKLCFVCRYGCTAGLRTAGVVRRGVGPAPPLVRVGCSRPSARHDTLSDDPHVAADTPAWIPKYVIHIFYFIPLSLQ
jgi:hypothetical protein